MSPIDDEKFMVTDWVATKLLKNRVHDVVAQKVVHDVLALISYCVGHQKPRSVMGLWGVANGWFILIAVIGGSWKKQLSTLSSFHHA